MNRHDALAGEELRDFNRKVITAFGIPDKLLRNKDVFENPPTKEGVVEEILKTASSSKKNKGDVYLMKGGKPDVPTSSLSPMVHQMLGDPKSQTTITANIPVPAKDVQRWRFMTLTVWTPTL